MDKALDIAGMKDAVDRLGLKQLLADNNIAYEEFLAYGKEYGKTETDDTGDWMAAKNIVDKMTFPSLDTRDWIEASGGEYHERGHDNHALKTYFLNLDPVEGYKLTAKVNRCPECKEVRNKLFLLENLKTDEVFIKWIYRGRREDITYEEGKDIFG